MPDDFLDYFERELSFLREMGSDFARRYPKVAGRLLLEPSKCEDPHTERLIEAFAFLCARIQRKIDDGLPEITQSLLQVLYPQLVTPIPSVSLVKFGPNFRNLPEAGYHIPKGTELFSKPVHGVSCLFRTVYPVTLWPIEVVDARLEEPRRQVRGAQQVVRIRLRVHRGAFQGDVLRFHLNGQPQHVFPLYQLLLSHVCLMECGAADAPASERLELPPGALLPVGFAAEEGLLPAPEQMFPGYRLLLEYFTLPQKFLSFEIVGLKGKAFGELLDLLLYLDRPAPECLVVGSDTFCLYATPVVNIFNKVAEPIRLDHESSDYRVVADLRREDGMEVLSIDDVTAVTPDSPSEVKRYSPVFGVENGPGCEGELPLWHMHRRPSSRPHDGGTDVFLSFSNGNVNCPVPETVLVRCSCSNRDLPAKLPFGDPAGDFQTELPAPLQAISCLIKPTTSLRPPLDGGRQRSLISHLSLNYLSLVDTGAGALREILHLYDFCGSASTRQEINGIESVSSRPVTRRMGAGFCRGVEVTIEFDEEKYIGSSLYLFAAVLERFLGQYVSVNSFVQVIAKTTRDNSIFKQWPPRSGDRVLL
ncbi:type VI secretion system baseplate subunit TssF [Geomonas propionica]|uniref:Type VI secretion system baseplate subunit TssF n=1 Tax=Geomonas propionica TaxID=2798582 RepID=A0ABS0YQ01_9BACT|nr:type VI secretion system baseplate subunit TssF [Geomonas propionica]MBJ6799958.1 type VI secretion system baseplate subunit TssF [Geomonas propionica]